MKLLPQPIPSYWLRDRHPLNSSRTTPSLPETCDIAIIGSGLAGITTAYHLLRGNSNPPRIVLLDARELCTGATARNGGHVKVTYGSIARILSTFGSAAVSELQAHVHSTIDSLKAIVELENLDCELELRRSFDVQTTVAQTEEFKAIYDSECAKGAAWTRTTSWIGPEHAEQITSVKGAASAFSVPTCSFWPYKFCTQLVQLMMDHFPGFLNLQMNTPVVRVEECNDGSNDIKTSRGVLKAGKVVFATNAYTSGLVPQFDGIITPVRGMATHIVSPEPVHPHLSHTYNISFDPSEGVNYHNPRPDGSIVVGGGSWKFRDDRSAWYNNFDDSTNFRPKVQAYWENYAQRTFLGWENSGASSDLTWPGIMGNTMDGWPHVGLVPGAKNQSQWMLCGFNGGGMALILGCSKVIGSMIKEGKTFEDARGEFGVPEVFGTSEKRLKAEEQTRG